MVGRRFSQIGLAVEGTDFALLALKLTVVRRQEFTQRRQGLFPSPQIF